MFQNFPIIFHGVEGQDEREEQSPSFFNKSEIEVVVSYVKKLIEKRGGQKIKEDDIGVISPYRKQVRHSPLVARKGRGGWWRGVNGGGGKAMYPCISSFVE